MNISELNDNENFYEQRRKLIEQNEIAKANYLKTTQKLKYNRDYGAHFGSNTMSLSNLKLMPINFSDHSSNFAMLNLDKSFTKSNLFSNLDKSAESFN